MKYRSRIFVKKNCKRCGKEFGLNSNGRLYCSGYCKRVAEATRKVKCVNCGIPLGKLGKKYCSQRCDDVFNQSKRQEEHRLRYAKKWGVGEIPAPDDLIFSNYKEPLRRFEGGYGYEGCLAYNKEMDKVQCHLCGKMFKSLTGAHFISCHNISSKEYKVLTKLAQETALCGEGVRKKLIDNYKKNDNCIKNIEQNNMNLLVRKALRDKLIESNKKRTGEKIALEIRNKRGNCPDQLLDKIKKLAEKLGYTPSVKEFKVEYDEKFTGTIYETFGSWREAIKLAGMKSKADEMSEKYSEERLIEYMRNFYKMNKRTPISSDFRRGLLPSRNVYQRRWGSLNNARRAAGVPVVIQLSKFKYKEVKLWESGK